jgi:hypothetical protein
MESTKNTTEKIIKPSATTKLSNKEQFHKMQLIQHFMREEIKDIYKTQHLRQRHR